LGIEDGAAAGQGGKRVNQKQNNRLPDVHAADAGASLCAWARQVKQSSSAMASGFFARKLCYEERAFAPRHSFAEMKRMHGQKPLWSPGAWQEYLCTA